MVSFWPWRSDSSSTASFEKALSTISAKINATQSQLDRTRSNSRRVKVLWSLYLSFAYLVYAIVLVLVVGWKHMGPWEWTGISGGPVLIYVTRTVLSAFFNYRIESLSSRLKEYQTERAKTVQKLKDATKYDSTLELLEKYGGEPKRGKGGKAGSAGEGEENSDAAKARQGQTHGDGPGPRKGPPGRTGMAPPPTANIPRGASPGTPLAGPGGSQLSPLQQQHRPQTPQGYIHQDTSAEFAPNAFGPGGPPPPPMRSAQYAPAPPQQGASESHWYDRIMDLLLGEDEAAAKNRIVLICAQCRLVNGQAPPGTKSLADVGRWRCMSCGSLNGEDSDEGRRIVKEVLEERGAAAAADSTDGEFKTETDDDSFGVVQVAEKAGGEDQPQEGGLKKRKGKGRK